MAPFRAKYPHVFKEIKHLSVNKGWFKLIHELCVTLEHHIQRLPFEIKGEMYAVQIKEKFGGLRFYMKQTTPYMDGAISLAEGMSYSICENCGGNGQRRGGGYILTLCDPCHEENLKLRNEGDDNE